jgi:hypothetical protein
MYVSRANRTVREVNLIVEEANARAEELEKVRAVFFLKLSDMA